MLVKKTKIGIIVIVGIAVIMAYFIAIILFSYKQHFFELDKTVDGNIFGQFGSFLGGILAPIITFLSVILFSNALKLQREDLNEQKDEFLKQNRLTVIQQFETKFFNLLNLHNQIKNNIENSGARQKKLSRGKTFFEELTYKIKEASIKGDGTLINHNSIKIHPEPKKQLIKFYNELFYEYKDFLGHYFRNLYHLIKFIDEYEESNGANKNIIMSEKERYNYGRTVRSQLSNAEIILLAYNGLTPYGSAFHSSIEKYKLLKNIAFDDTIVGLKEVLLDEYPHLKKEYGTPWAKKSI